MAANIDPIFSKVGAIGFPGTNPLTAAANDFTGIGANNILVFTADATNGSFVQRLRITAAGTNVASVLRIFINNGSTNGTASNNVCYGQISLPATTASATSALVELDYPLNLALPASYRIYVGLGTAVSAGWIISTIAGNY